MALPSWSDLLEKMRPELKGTGSAFMQRRRGAAEFVEWAETTKLPFDGDEKTIEKAITDFTATLEVHRRANGTLSKQGEAALTMAKELLDRSKRYFSPPEPEPEPKTEEPSTTEETEEMPKRMAEQEQELEQEMEQQEEYVDEDTELLAEEEEEVEEQPRRKQRPPPVQVQYVQAPPRGRRAPPVEKAAPRSSAFKNILPRPEKIRLYKRNEMGKRELIDDFTVDEIGDMKLEQFIREYIHAQFSNEGMDTEYIAYELDSRTGKEKQPPSSITLRGEEQQQQVDPFNTVRKAMGMLQEMQGFAQQPQQAQAKNPMLEVAQQKAVQTGDFNGMMMLMMMERMMAAPTTRPNEELLLKVIDRLEKVERGERPGPMRAGPDFAGPPGFGPPGFGGFPPPPFYPPPPPMREPPHREDRGTDKLLDLAMAKLAQPPPSLADSVKELMALQTIMSPQKGDTSEVAQLRAEIRALAEKNAPRGADSLEASLATFEKLTTIAKSVTQQTGGSDMGGFLKNLITPEVGKVIGSIVASAQAGQQPPQAPLQGPMQPPVQAQSLPPAPMPRDPNAPPQPPPKAVQEAVKMFQFAQTPEVQAQRFVDVVLAMYLSQDPFYVKLLQPALDDLNKADQSVEFLKTPRRIALLLINEMVPRLATPDFADAAIAALALKAGVEQLPDTLVSTKGKWTFRNNEVVMLEEVAKPVEEKKEEVRREPEVIASPPASPPVVIDVQEPAPSAPVAVSAVA